jgi:hypothetical protein
MQARLHQHALILALCQQATALAQSGLDGSAAAATRAAALAGAARSDPDAMILPLDEAEALTTLAECLSAQGRRPESRQAALAAALSCRSEVEDAAADPAFGARARIDLAGLLCVLAERLYDIGALADSLAIVGLAEQLGASPDDPAVDARPRQAASLELRSAVLRALQRRRDAVRAGRQAVVLYRALAAADPGRFSGELARALDTLAFSEGRAKARALRGEAGQLRTDAAGKPGD